MPNTPIASNENLTLAEFEDEHRPMAGPAAEPGPAAQTGSPMNEPLPVSGDDAVVGPALKGTDEEAIVRRETDV